VLVKNLWLIAALLFAPYAAAQVSKAPVLICTPMSQVDVSDSGQTVIKKPGVLGGDKMLIDLGAGLVRQPPDGRPVEWSVTQTMHDDFSLSLFFNGHSTGHYLKIHPMKKSITFIRIDNSGAFFGTCEPIK
jgi:hypothetical protein